ncbi:MAG: hypothetical protein JNL98_00520 [Bryobacterales bacterium]|nr:hypothetical protein [Bryobacterales bacterium]
MSRKALLLLWVTTLLSNAPAQTLPMERGLAVRALRHSDPEGARLARERRLQLPSRTARIAPATEHRLALLPDADIAAARRSAPDGVTFAGLHRDVPASLFREARLDRLDSGRQIWRISVRSPGAAGIRLHFTDFDIGGGRLWVHDGTGDEAEIHGPYLGRGVFGDGDFWSDVVLNENIVVEYEPSAPMGPVDDPPFQIREISHLTSEGLPRLADSKSPARSAAAPCHVDVTCHPDWAETSKAVALILYEADRRTFSCSGTLLNTRTESRVPYFLTAQHCIDNEAAARTVNAFWQYQSSRCNGAPPDRRSVPRTLGARYLAGLPFQSGDATLIQLTSVPDGVNFSGWDPSPLAAGVSVTGIHHPAGDYKRISFGSSMRPVPFAGKDLDTFVAAFWNGGGLTEGGSSGSGLFRENLMLVGILSHGPKADTPAEFCSIVPFADNYGRFSTFFPVIREFLEGRTAAPPPATNLPAGGALVSGQARSITIPPVTSARLLNGTNGFTINVPAGATRLEVTLRTSTPNADLDLFARFGQDVALDGARAVADFRSEGTTGDEQIVITGTNLRAGNWFIALGVFTPGVEIRATLTATVTAGTTQPPPTTGQTLTSGVARNINFPAVQGATLFNGPASLTITVPQGATRLEVDMRAITLNADVDLYIRRNQDVGLDGRFVVADFLSEREGDSNESIVISQPQLQPGTYFIAFGVYTRNTPIQVSLTATVVGGSTAPPSGAQNPLVSSEPRSLTLSPVNGPTLIAGASSFTITVPQGATRLEVTLRSPTPEADVDLYIRRDQNVTLENGRVVADFRSDRDGDSNESIILTPPQLAAGTYYIALGVFTPNRSIQVTLTATVSTGTTGPTAPSNVLVSGQPRSFNIGPVTGGALFRGANSGFTITVPQNATRLQISLRTTPADADVDLYARAGQDIGLDGGRIVADARSERPDGTEDIVITGTALQPGTYFIGFGLFSPGVVVQCTVTATVTTGTAPPPTTTGPVTLTSGVSAPFRLPAVSSGTLVAGNRGFRIQVPQGASRLEIRMTSTTASGPADMDLYARFGQDVSINDGVAVADHLIEAPGGTATMVILPTSSPQLRAGTYFIALGQFTKDAEINGSLTATVSTAPAAPTPSALTVLTSGVGVKFALPAVTENTLFFGNRSFRIDVPQGATRLTIQMKADDPGVDTDLFVRAGADTEVDGQGNVVADYAATSRFGDETLTIDLRSQPPLRPGSYFISIGVFTRNLPSSGTITATVERTTFNVTSGTVLNNGTPVLFRLPAVPSPTLFAARDGFQISVPEGVTRLDVTVKSDSPATDVDLFVRFGAPPEITSAGALLTDYGAVTDSGNEEISITASSRPPVRAGTYHIGLGLFSLNAPAGGSILAAFSTQPTEATPDDGVSLRERPGIYFHWDKGTLHKEQLRAKVAGSAKSENGLLEKKKVRAADNSAPRVE